MTPEKAGGIGASDFRERFQGNAFDLRGSLRHPRDIGWLSPLSPMRFRREKGCVGFQHQPVERCGGQGRSDRRGVSERDDPRVADETAHGKDAAQKYLVAGETMEDGGDAIGPGPPLFEGVVGGIPLMNNAGQTRLRGHLEVHPEQLGLAMSIGNCGRGRGSGGSGGPAIVIETGLAQGDHPGMPGQFAEPVAEVGRRLGRIVGMPADRGIDARVLAAEFDRAPAALEVRADGNDPSHAPIRSPPDDLGQIGLEIRVMQMGVRIA